MRVEFEKKKVIIIRESVEIFFNNKLSMGGLKWDPSPSEAPDSIA